ncbi:helix-turn-helix domain-containing protein [Desulfosediminicola sp.]|uniref:helix-turn-helix domain-containing protein n=1 Tax=Desulfosediminicola sp. TaxID=2886825 RepID=UPI003AF1FE41
MHNPELQYAEEFVQHTRCNIFLTGKAGTGKTTFLHKIKEQTEKRLIITAPTGVAAINAGGVTLHSFFQLPFGPYRPGTDPFAQQNKHRMSKEKRNIINSLDLLVIDEISMVRADLLDLVDCVLRKYRRTDAPFGGVQLLMIGDLHQLSPVVKESDWQILGEHYDSPYFFSSQALKQTELIPIELKHIYRQSDTNFIELLNLVRDNKLDSTSLKELNSRHIPDFKPDDSEGYITLSTHNASADTINRAKLDELSGLTGSYDAELDGDFPEHTYPTAAALQLKVGAQVMFVRNDSSHEKRFFNGKIGKITRMSSDEIEVSCPDELETIEVERATWENIEYSIDPATSEINQKTIGTFAQFPLKLAWAITIHKSQGLTFDKAIIDAQSSFAHGQVYVALSRCRTFEGMVLSAPLTNSSIRTDHTVQRFVRDAADNSPSGDKLEVSKIRYQQQLLMECFDFRKLQSNLARLAANLRRNESVIQVYNGADMTEIERRCNEEITSVGENFRRQLLGLFSDTSQPVEDNAIRERLAKSSGYFQGKFSEILTSLAENLSIETDNKEVRKRVNNSLQWFQEEYAVKLAAIRAMTAFSPATYLRALSVAEIEATKPKKKVTAPTYSEADVGHPEFFEQLKEWRRKKAGEKHLQLFQVMHQKTLVQIAVHLPDSMPALKNIKGIGKKLADNYGAELIALAASYRRTNGIASVDLPDMPLLQTIEKKAPAQNSAKDAVATDKADEPKPKSNTKEESYNLFKLGKSINNIAAERELTTGTVENHLAYYVEKGKIPVVEFVAEERVEAVSAAVRTLVDAPMREIKTALEEQGIDASYSDIKFTRAHLRSTES